MFASLLLLFKNVNSVGWEVEMIGVLFFFFLIFGFWSLENQTQVQTKQGGSWLGARGKGWSAQP